MKILFICCAGMSSSLVVKRLEDYIKQLNDSKTNLNISIEAIPLDKFKFVADDYSLILLAPQIAYKLKDFKTLMLESNKDVPVGVVKGLDYGLIKVENILKSALKLLNIN
ncbi:MAG: PTS sugar transporter subunit IIB [Sarcina sp.]